MTVEQPEQIAHVYFVNATDAFGIDIYANGAPEPSMTDASPLELGGLFEVDGGDGRPFGDYTFEVREKDQDTGPVLAKASVKLTAGASYSAVFHYDAERDYALSLYADDFSASGNTRLEVRHVGAAETIDWTIQPRDGADPRVPAESRAGRLGRGQWQQATEVPPNAYRVEVKVGETLMAYLEDLTLEQEKAMVVYYVGTPHPQSMQTGELRKYLLHEDYRVATGPVGEARVTEPMQPLNGPAPVDAHAPVSEGPMVFDCAAVETYATNPVEREVRAHDPGGKVTQLTLVGALPGGGTVAIVDGSVQPAAEAGADARALLSIGADVPVGEHALRIKATSDSGGAGTCALPVTVKPVTLERLCERIGGFRVLGEIQARTARELDRMLTAAGQAFAAGDLAGGRATLESFVARLEAGKGGAIAETAAAALTREAKSLSASIACD
jgi:hypothetical protein